MKSVDFCELMTPPTRKYTIRANIKKVYEVSGTLTCFGFRVMSGEILNN